MSEKFIEGRIVGRVDYTDSLFSLRFEAPMDPFIAGQYCRAGLILPGARGAEITMRPYSMVNAPDQHPHELLLTLVPQAVGGIVSPALHQLRVGDAICIGPRANGFFSMPEVPDAEVLWCLATGTGIGPFMSILHTAAPWQKFRRIVVVHAVRYAAELAYRSAFELLSQKHNGALTYVPFVSREAAPDALYGRIPAAIADGRLEARVGIALTPENSHCMLCGNPQMVTDTMVTLESKGLRKHRRRTPGQITTEAYW